MNNLQNSKRIEIISIFPKNRPLSKKQSDLLKNLFIEFLIEDCQPLYILKSQSFQRFIYSLNPGFSLPNINQVEEKILIAFKYTELQLKNILDNDNISMFSITTDFWTSRSKHGYIGITCSWLAEDFTPKEALLSLGHVPYPHTGEVISDLLYDCFEKWNFVNRNITITTDNGSNILKAVRLLKDHMNINHLSCSAHTLQLAINLGL